MQNETEIEQLNTLVSAAIWRAEQAEACISPAAELWSEVSALEEQLAARIPASEPEGRAARRGTVRAALAAGDSNRAQALVDRYVVENACSSKLANELQTMLNTSKKYPRIQPYNQHLNTQKRRPPSKE